MKLHEFARQHSMHPAKMMLLLGKQGAEFDEIWPEVAEKWLGFQPDRTAVATAPRDEQKVSTESTLSANGSSEKDYDLIAFLPDNIDPAN